MEKQDKINLDGNELVTLASSLAICLTQKLSASDVCIIRQFLSTLISNLSLIEGRDKICKKLK